MKKLLPGLFLSLLPVLIPAQSVELAYWNSVSASGGNYPLPAEGMSNMLYDAVLDYLGADIPVNGWELWASTDSKTEVDPYTSPYLSFRLGLIEVISFDRFVIQTANVCPDSGLAMQLRWSEDGFASSLGDFTRGVQDGDSESVDLWSADLTAVRNVEFRIYFYAATGRAHNHSRAPKEISQEISFSIFGRKSCKTATRIDAAECGGYTSPSGRYTWTSSGTYMDTIPNSEGCDNLLYIDLIILDSAVGIDSQTTRGPFTWIDGNTYTENNHRAVFNIAGGAVNGCDSLVRLDLTIVSEDLHSDSVRNK